MSTSERTDSMCVTRRVRRGN